MEMMIRRLASCVGILAMAGSSFVGCPATLLANEYELTRRIFDKSGRHDDGIAVAPVALGIREPSSADPASKAIEDAINDMLKAQRAIEIVRREILMNAAREHRYKAKQQYKEAGGFLAVAGVLGTLMAAGSFYPSIFPVVGLMVGIMAFFAFGNLLIPAISRRDSAMGIVVAGAAVVTALSFLFPWGIGALTLLVGAVAALAASGRSLNDALDNRRQAKNLEAEAEAIKTED